MTWKTLSRKFWIAGIHGVLTTTALAQQPAVPTTNVDSLPGLPPEIRQRILEAANRLPPSMAQEFLRDLGTPGAIQRSVQVCGNVPFVQHCQDLPGYGTSSGWQIGTGEGPQMTIERSANGQRTLGIGVEGTQPGLAGATGGMTVYTNGNVQACMGAAVGVQPLIGGSVQTCYTLDRQRAQQMREAVDYAEQARSYRESRPMAPSSTTNPNGDPSNPFASPPASSETAARMASPTDTASAPRFEDQVFNRDDFRQAVAAQMRQFNEVANQRTAPTTPAVATTRSDWPAPPRIDQAPIDPVVRNRVSPSDNVPTAYYRIGNGEGVRYYDAGGNRISGPSSSSAQQYAAIQANANRQIEAIRERSQSAPANYGYRIGNSEGVRYYDQNGMRMSETSNTQPTYQSTATTGPTSSNSAGQAGSERLVMNDNVPRRSQESARIVFDENAPRGGQPIQMPDRSSTPTSTRPSTPIDVPNVTPRTPGQQSATASLTFP